MQDSSNRSPLAAVLSPIRSALLHAGGFSVFVNLMLLGPTLYLLQVYDRVLASRSNETLLMLSIGVAISLIAMAVMDGIRARLLVASARQIDEILAGNVLRQMIRSNSGPSRGPNSSGLRDVATLRTFCSGSNIIALFDAPWLIIYVVVIFLFHPAMGLLALGGAIALLLLALISERSNRKALERYAEATRDGSRIIDQGLRNADVINAMGMISAFSAHWGQVNRNTLELMETTASRGSRLHSTSKFLRQAIQSAMMGLGAWLVLDDHVTPGIMIAATILFGRAMAPAEAVIGNWSALVNARVAWNRLQAIIADANGTSVPTALPEPSGRVQMEGVSLFGRSRDALLLRNIGFDLPAGKSLGVLGPSGAGKSSLLRVMLGVWKPSAGTVRVDGADLGQWDAERLGAHIGYLPQDVELFPGTIAENISRFRTDTSQHIVEAARRANAYEMILRLPDGFDTRLGDGGIQLSAGQAQRVGLARALYGKPKLVVLDEPNANLDAEGEQALVAALADLKRAATTIVMVTHKPSLVAALDYLLVMRDGQLELLGPKDEVLSRLAGQSAPLAVVRS